ncbi:sigma-70 family RNA polymerase sigma factor [Chloroflexi bacterium TSY]|nr:sigma-70 family RNA polymerase sigma factor [Chloroflexi bacterium TSY]
MNPTLAENREDRSKHNNDIAEDEGLLRACRQGNEQAWDRLLDKYERLVFSIARNSGLSFDDAADITQQTFTILLQSLDQMTDEGSLSGWLSTVARRHSKHLLVRQLRRQSRLTDPEIAVGLLPRIAKEKSIEHWELAQWLQTGLSRLSERCRQLLTALYLDEKEPSYAEIANRMEMPEGSIGPTRARCLKRLRDLLGSS